MATGIKTGRKPIDQLSKVGRPTGRDAIWQLVRKLKRFTVGEIARELVVHDKTVRGYLTALEKSGRLVSEKADRRSARIFSLENDTGAETPRIRADGSVVTQGRGTDQLWRTMKILKNFDAEQLARAASTTAHTVSVVHAKDYIWALHKAGYLALVAKAKHGAPSALARYRLVRKTGPAAPMIQNTKRIWDPNLNEITWSEAGE